MQELLKGIDNKEILTKVLHHSIDYLIGNCDDNQTIRMCHKYGFHNPDDFLLATRTISKYYKNCYSGSGEAEQSLLSHVVPELRQLVSAILASRQPEMMAHLARYEYAKYHPFVESFGWETRLILCDSFSRNIRQLATLTLHCRRMNSKKYMICLEMDKRKLSDLIEVLEKALSMTPSP